MPTPSTMRRFALPILAAAGGWWLWAPRAASLPPAPRGAERVAPQAGGFAVQAPRGLSVDGAGRLLVADGGRLLAIANDVTTALIPEIVPPEVDVVAAGPRGVLYFATGNGESSLWRFDAAGRPTQWLRAAKPAIAHIVVDAADRVYVMRRAADGRCRVARVDGRERETPLDLVLPPGRHALGLAPNQGLYIAGNGVLARWTAPAGRQQVATSPTFADLAPGMCADGDKAVYTADARGIRRFEFMRQTSTDMLTQPLDTYPGLARDAAGDLYFSQPAANGLFRIRTGAPAPRRST